METPLFSAVVNILKSDAQDLNLIVCANSLGSTIVLCKLSGVYDIPATLQLGRDSNIPNGILNQPKKKISKDALANLEFHSSLKVYILDCISV